MKHKTLFCIALMLLLVGPAAAQQHRAMHLGNPATRFAPPISTPSELRSRFSNPDLKLDIESILRQVRWEGNLADLFNAAASNEVTEVSLPPGTRMSFMSSRVNGHPVALDDVLWAGKEPVLAYQQTALRGIHDGAARSPPGFRQSCGDFGPGSSNVLRNKNRRHPGPTHRRRRPRRPG